MDVILDVIKASPIGTRFKCDDFVCGASGTDISCVEEYKPEGFEFVTTNEVVEWDAIGKEAEGRDCLRDTQDPHAEDSDTGSGAVNEKALGTFGNTIDCLNIRIML